MTNQNRLRSLPGVISLEAWHKSFSPKLGRTDLHVDVAFMTGRLGGEPDDDVRFQLSLKQAQVVVIIPAAEPARFDTASVSRDTPNQTVKITETRQSSGRAKAGARLGLSTVPQALQMKADLGVEGSISRDQVTAITQQLHAMSLVHSKVDDGHAWTVTPTGSETLFGRPWNAGKEPRLKVIDQRNDRSSPIAPAIHVEVRCLRQDLHITDIRLKDEAAWSVLMAGAQQRNRIAAAEALIRTKLFEEGLFKGNVSDHYAQMTLAAIVAEAV
ncbi:hypothetical protein [Caulobacter segnis]|uniref:Uncharacterized protein n=1 Tax=Caulobacter segnis TaxID=88688 RepID=A0A2W5WGY7_9CAUL|nr:hypothetical protein [Caulobacter segnis]PZR32928.1 MAG: hypothetical protein DI526_15030 [Caulobacter segnis]